MREKLLLMTEVPDPTLLAPTRVAVIGTAGRDSTRPMTRGLWLAMVQDFRGRVRATDTLLSGGAAWADHLAVHAYLEGWCAGLELYLPAPIQPVATEGEDGTRHVFAGGPRTSGAAANLYHSRFQQATGVDGRAQIAAAIAAGALAVAEPVAAGYRAMFARNAKIARGAEAAIAYTWGEASHPAAGGTLDTWKQVRSTQKIHVSLHGLAVEASRTLAGA